MRKYIISVIISFLLLLGGGYGTYHYSQIKSPSIGCDTSLLWSHIYHPQRLKVIKDCVTVTGIIINAKAEADGDWHIRLDVDDKSYLNAKNISDQHGYLVVEPICENTVTQQDAVQACQGFPHKNIFTQSMIGKKVSVMGSWVLDQQHGWNEIHPVTSITIK